MRFKRPWQGFRRAFVRCKECRRIAYYFYQPYSLANPVLTLPCGHGLGRRFSESVTRITEKQARYWLRNSSPDGPK